MGVYQNWINSGRGNVMLSLPMKDAATCHINEAGTGDFTQNGLIMTADRGPNMDNCVSSYFDGVDDYLSSTGIGASATKVASGSFIFNPYDTGTSGILYNGKDTSNYFSVYSSGSDFIIKSAYLGDIKLILEIKEVLNKINIITSVSFTVDMDNQLSTKVFLNGVETAVTFTIFDIGENLGTNNNNTFCASGDYAGNNTMYGTIGELYFDTTYIDLATNNPFWDSETNKPIPVRKAMETLGSNPLICMPISADAPTLNYGSGGNFVLNGGGLQGSRGASEYIPRTIVSDASNKVTGSIFCKSLVKWVNSVPTYLNDVTLTETDAGTVGYYFGFSDTINWALESNKNLVTNQLGYPRQPSQVISDSGWTPVLGLFFEDSSNFGLNSYGADYSVTGSPISGADIKV